MNPLVGELPNPFSGGKIVGKDVPHDKYAKQKKGVKRGDPRWEMSRGELMKFAACPAKWIEGVPEDVTAAMKWGSLIDCLLLTPDHFSDRYAVTPETYVNKDGKTCDWRNDRRIRQVADWLDANASKEPVSAKDLAEAKNNVARILTKPHIQHVIEHSDKQVWVQTEYLDKETEIAVPFKCLLDVVPDKSDGQWGKTLGDLKLTTNASRGAWTSKLFHEGYHIQAAAYLDAYRAASKEDRCDWFNIVSEDAPPYEAVIWPLSADFVELGRSAVIGALQFYCRCLKAGKWPGYNDEPLTLSSYIQPSPFMVSAI